MVDNIRRGMLAGQQMMANKQPSWREGIIGAAIDASQNAVAASMDFQEREKQLVWKRLNLEADALQTAQLEAIKTAQTIDEIPGIVQNFQQQIKDNMGGQKYGKEWLDSLGAAYLSANNNDVNKAVAAKEKELLGIKMDETLKQYADVIAASDDEKAMALTNRAYADVEQLGAGVLTPEEMHKTKGNFDNLVKTRRNDIIRAQKQAVEQQKLQNNESINDLYTDYLNGGLTKEKLLQAAKEGVFKYAPEKYNKLIGWIEKKDKELSADNESAVQYVKTNWAAIDEEELQRLQLEGKLTEKTYKLYSAMKAKTSERKKNEGYSKDDKAAFGAELLQKARDGEDVGNLTEDYLIAGKIEKTAADLIKSTMFKIQGYSSGYKDVIEKIKKGEINEDADISELGLPEKEEKEAKNYLKEVKEREKNKALSEKNIIDKSWDDLAKNIGNGSITDEETLRSSPYWESYTAKQQSELTAGLAVQNEKRTASIMKDGKDKIRTNNITDETGILEYAGEYGLDQEQADELRKFMVSLNNDKYGVLTAALDLGNKLLPKGETPAEIEAAEKYQNYVQEIFDKAIEAGKSPSEIGGLLSKDVLYKYINDIKPSKEDILQSMNPLTITKATLDREFDDLVKYDKKSKSYVVTSNDINPFINYAQRLDAAVAQKKITNKDYQEKKEKLAPFLLQQIQKMEDDAGEDTILGDIYRSAVNIIGAQNISDVGRYDLIMDIADRMSGANIGLQETRGGIFSRMMWGEYQAAQEKADKGGYNVIAPAVIVQQAVGNFVGTQVDSTVPPDASKIVVGNNVVENPLYPDNENKGVLGASVNEIVNRFEGMKEEGKGGLVPSKNPENSMLNFWKKIKKDAAGRLYGDEDKPAGLKNIRGVFGK